MKNKGSCNVEWAPCCKSSAHTIKWFFNKQFFNGKEIDKEVCKLCFCNDFFLFSFFSFLSV